MSARSAAVRAPTASTEPPPSDHQRERLFEVIGDFKTALLVTHRRDEGLHARPLAVAKIDRAGKAYFATGIASPKVTEIEADPRVLVTFQSASEFASVAGWAKVVRDRKLVDELWSEAWRVWFPGGKDDPELALIEVTLHEGEYWDQSGLKGIRYAFEAVKAVVTGTTPDRTEDGNARVNLSTGS